MASRTRPIAERLRCIAATADLRAHLPEATLTIGVQDRTELAHAAHVDTLLRPPAPG